MSGLPPASAARLYKVPVGGFVGGDDDDVGFGGEDDRGHGRTYKPVPQNYQLLFDEETKRIMEFPADWQPCFLPGGPNTCPSNPFAQDGMSKLKRMYADLQAGKRLVVQSVPVLEVPPDQTHRVHQ